MEAASARYATRDRFGGFGEPAQTPLQRYIRMSVLEEAVGVGSKLKLKLNLWVRKCCGSSEL